MRSHKYKTCYHGQVRAIGQYNETELHEQLKHIYAGTNGATERDVDGFVVDVVTDDRLIEIQTRGLGKLRRKIETLRSGHRITIVHPIAVETIITKLAADGELLGSRRSPRKGRLEHAFREIVSIADLLPHRNVTIELVLVRAVETRMDDGKGSWRRRGVSIVARQLGEIVARHAFRTRTDYLRMLPEEIPTRFTNGDIITVTGLRYRDVQPITSSLRKMGLIRLVDKRGREQVYERASKRPR